jgi:hypothetical protein
MKDDFTQTWRSTFKTKLDNAGRGGTTNLNIKTAKCNHEHKTTLQTPLKKARSRQVTVLFEVKCSCSNSQRDKRLKTLQEREYQRSRCA